MLVCGWTVEADEGERDAPPSHTNKTKTLCLPFLDGRANAFILIRIPTNKALVNRRVPHLRRVP
jgi:hypothetical protein